MLPNGLPAPQPLLQLCQFFFSFPDMSVLPYNAKPILLLEAKSKPQQNSLSRAPFFLPVTLFTEIESPVSFGMPTKILLHKFALGQL